MNFLALEGNPGYYWHTPEYNFNTYCIYYRSTIIDIFQSNEQKKRGYNSFIERSLMIVFIKNLVNWRAPSDNE